MTSARPKLKPEAPKAITGWDTLSGRSLWMTQQGAWSADAGELGIFIGDEAEARLAEALTQEAVVTDPYFMEISAGGEIMGREILRERLRAHGWEAEGLPSEYLLEVIQDTKNLQAEGKNT